MPNSKCSNTHIWAYWEMIIRNKMENPYNGPSAIMVKRWMVLMRKLATRWHADWTKLPNLACAAYKDNSSIAPLPHLFGDRGSVDPLSPNKSSWGKKQYGILCPQTKISFFRRSLPWLTEWLTEWLIAKATLWSYGFADGKNISLLCI